MPEFLSLPLLKMSDDESEMTDQERADFIEDEKADEWHDQKVDREE